MCSWKVGPCTISNKSLNNISGWFHFLVKLQDRILTNLLKIDSFIGIFKGLPKIQYLSPTLFLKYPIIFISKYFAMFFYYVHITSICLYMSWTTLKCIKDFETIGIRIKKTKSCFFSMVFIIYFITFLLFWIDSKKNSGNTY